ncbi:ribosome-binding factor A [Marinicauda pacifica]|jgi:ribosome-binding factor A|uniref:Ribosome-binding factor A n=1 Tax=Marinicauda pacifica TaxID=1133559 RepID=A0A4V6RF84_9PROT|nr:MULTISPECIES: 30S ribosome-binding factor RbfA [Marinicauda]TGY92529.1 30S ribosome-binding factor RbfA [Marinicauda pacifica]GGE49680.1 ribosome-binding factor A [Marinicauda pacifica]
MKTQSQRQLRGGELVRRAVADIIAEGHLHDRALDGVSITITEARMSPDMRHATVFISALGLEDPNVVAAGLNRAHGFIQKELGRQIEMKFTPKLVFRPDDRFEEAQHVEEILDRPGVKRDLEGDGGES